MYNKKYGTSKHSGHISFFLRLVVSLFIAILLLPSCKISQPSYFFKNIVKDTSITGFVNTADVELKIVKNDILFITVSSLSKEEDSRFNDPILLSTGAGVYSGYQVSLDGSISLHQLGKIHVEGMTRKELKLKLEKDLLPFLKEPIATINFSNHFVTVLGEVRGPQVVKMPAEKIALIDVIASTGSVTDNAKVSNVLVVRETVGTKEFKRLNLEDQSIITSPWYYLQPNDIVVVNPDEERMLSDQKRSRAQQIFTITLSTISIAVVLIDRLFR